MVFKHEVPPAHMLFYVQEDAPPLLGRLPHSNTQPDDQTELLQFEQRVAAIPSSQPVRMQSILIGATGTGRQLLAFVGAAEGIERILSGMRIHNVVTLWPVHIFLENGLALSATPRRRWTRSILS